MAARVTSLRVTRSALAVVIALAPACAGPLAGAPGWPLGSGRETIVILDPPHSFAEGWEHLVLEGETDYELALAGEALAIHAVAHRSASGLMRRVRIEPERCRRLEWAWRVDQVHTGADLRERDREDVAAALYVLFGNPEGPLGPRPVPTLRYVWTNDRLPRDSVIDSPYLPGTVRSLVLRGDPADLGSWRRERRDVVADFQRAFARPPDDVIEAVALFTDGDQTGEDAEAWYGPIRIHCGPVDEDAE